MPRRSQIDRGGARRSVLLGAALLLVACESSLGPDRVRISSEPKGARTFVDGTAVGATDLEHELRYYGTYDLELVRAPYLPGRQYFVPVHELRTLPAPASPYLFPLDFVVEIGQRVLGWQPEPIELRLPSRDLRADAEHSAEQFDVGAAIRAADRAARIRR